MSRQQKIHGFLTALAVVLTFNVWLPARQAPATPTKDKPLRLRAIGQSMNIGKQGRIDIAIERWTSDAERKQLMGLLVKGRDQTPLLRALEKVSPRTGYIKSPTSLAWDLKYARENPMPDGTRQFVIATDKPVTFWGAYTGSRTYQDYPFTFIQIRMKENGKGEGKVLTQTNMTVTKDNVLEFESYGQEPVRLTEVWVED